MSARPGQSVGELGELELVERIRRWLGTMPGNVECGPGDDAAIVRAGAGRLVLSTDSLRESTHFRLDWISAHDLGRRALMVSASDIGAMGADPLCALCALELPASTAVSWVRDLMAGLAAGGREIGCPLVGGDVSRADAGVSIAMTLAGRLPPGRAPLLRSGAAAGDGCWITGVPGLAAAGRWFLEHGVEATSDRDRSLAVAAYRCPRPPLRFAAALAQQRLANAAMDISDGVAIDATRLCRASGTGLLLEAEKLEHPLVTRLAGMAGCPALDWVLGGGEDYALLCAVPKDQEARFEALATDEGVEVGRLGTFTNPDNGLRVALADGTQRVLEGLGWDHFRGQQE